MTGFPHRSLVFKGISFPQGFVLRAPLNSNRTFIYDKIHQMHKL